MDLEYDVVPQGVVLEEFMDDRGRISMIMGPLGSGKTIGTCLKILELMTEQEPNQQGKRLTRWLAVRNTYQELFSTTIKDWLACHDDLGNFVNSTREPPHQNIFFRLEDGTEVVSEIYFIAFDKPDHVKKARGTQFTGIWLNEVKEIPKAVIDILDLRHGRYPSPMDGVEPTWHGMIGDTNAPDEDHWYFDLAENHDLPDWHFYRQPGGVTKQKDPDTGVDTWVPNPNAENLKNLPGGIEYYSKGLQGKNDDWISVNLANNYGFVVDGKAIWPEYNDSLHCDHNVEFHPDTDIIGVGIDFGLTPACVFSQVDPMDGQIQIVEELVSDDMGALQFGKVMGIRLRSTYAKQAAEIWGDPAGEGRAQTDETTPFQILNGLGIPAFPAPTNDFTIRREAVAARLQLLTPMGRPGIVISPKCKILRKAFAGGYKYRRLQVSGDERYVDKPDKNMYSHVAEALQYLLVGMGEGMAIIGQSNTWGQAQASRNIRRLV